MNRERSTGGSCCGIIPSFIPVGLGIAQRIQVINKYLSNRSHCRVVVAYKTITGICICCSCAEGVRHTALVTKSALCALHTLSSLGSLCSLCTRSALSTSRSLCTRDTLQPCCALVALNTLRTLRASRSGSSRTSLSARSTGLSGCSLVALDTLRSLSTL